MYNSRIVNIFGRFFSYYLGAFWVVIWALFGLLSGRFLGYYLGAFWVISGRFLALFLALFGLLFGRFLDAFPGAFWALSGRFLGAFLRPNRAGIFYTSLLLLLQGPIGATCWAQYIYSMYTFAEVHIFVHSHRIGQRK